MRSGVRKMAVKIETELDLSILIVDDSINTGAEMRRARSRIESLNTQFKYLYCTIYANDLNNLPSEVDLCFSSLPQPRLFQWNYRNHIIAENACFDMDGVLCEDPTNEQNDDGKEYLKFISNAKPLFIPQKKISSIVTSRLERYRDQTETWLRKHKVRYGQLIMLNLPSAEERRKQNAHALFKAEIYSSRKEILFVESNWKQAQRIVELSDKPVICTHNDAFLYGRDHLATLHKTEQVFSYDLLNTQEALRIENAKLLDRLFELEKEFKHTNSITAKGTRSVHLPNSPQSVWTKPITVNAGIIASRNKRYPKNNSVRNKKKLSILLISFSFDKKVGAGAATSSYRLCHALSKQNTVVNTISLEEFPGFKVNSSNQPIGKKALAFWNSYYDYNHSKQLRKRVEEIDPDVIVLGAIDRGIVSLFDIASLDYPIVWIARDNWSHTGGCLFQLGFTKMPIAGLDQMDKDTKDYISVLGCGKYLSKCNDCPAITDQRERSISTLQFELKELIYNYRTDIIFAPISKWLEGTMHAARLTKNHRIHQIYNPIDLSQFRPLSTSKSDLRRKYQLPLDKNILLVSAHSLENKRKGVALLHKTLLSRKIPDNIQFLLMGKACIDMIPREIRSRFNIFGYVESDSEKVDLYNAADATVVSALQESLSVVASDSIACGTPVISFATSGLIDFIEHKKNGYLVKAFDVTELAKGINWVCHKGKSYNLEKNSRKTAEKLFDEKKNTMKYIDLFYDAIKTKKYLGPIPAEIKTLESTFRWLDDYFKHRHNHIKYMEKRIKSSDNTKHCEAERNAILSRYAEDKKLRFKDNVNEPSLSAANRLFREGKYARALAMYQLLHHQHPLDIYSNNAAMAAARLAQSQDPLRQPYLLK